MLLDFHGQGHVLFEAQPFRELGRHGVERRGQTAQLVPTPNGGPGRKIALGQAADDAAQFRHRPGDPPCAEKRHEHGGGDGRQRESGHHVERQLGPVEDGHFGRVRLVEHGLARHHHEQSGAARGKWFVGGQGGHAADIQADQDGVVALDGRNQGGQGPGVVGGQGMWCQCGVPAMILAEKFPVAVDHEPGFASGCVLGRDDECRDAVPPAFGQIAFRQHAFQRCVDAGYAEQPAVSGGDGHGDRGRQPLGRGVHEQAPRQLSGGCCRRVPFPGPGVIPRRHVAMAGKGDEDAVR